MVGVGEIISLVAVSSPSSEDAFAACRFGIGRLKKMGSIAKREVCG
jgi:molybdopterin synthase catalytic subunit